MLVLYPQVTPTLNPVEPPGDRTGASAFPSVPRRHPPNFCLSTCSDTFMYLLDMHKIYMYQIYMHARCSRVGPILGEPLSNIRIFANF